MYCRKCGKEVPKDSKFCPSCGDTQETIVVDNKKENHLANVLCTISLCLYFGMPIVSFIVYIFSFGLSFEGDSTASVIGSFTTFIMSIVSTLSTLAAYVLMIVARVKCPKSTYAKIVMWVYIALFIMGILTILFLLFICFGILVELGARF